jgi:hypothetical protein
LPYENLVAESIPEISKDFANHVKKYSEAGAASVTAIYFVLSLESKDEGHVFRKKQFRFSSRRHNLFNGRIFIEIKKPSIILGFLMN